ncbi:MAG: response regulator [Cryomorphaceae bacterium]|nr:MAG: response regulator [Cryomorphaceae bacterium]
MVSMGKAPFSYNLNLLLRFWVVLFVWFVPTTSSAQSTEYVITEPLDRTINISSYLQVWYDATGNHSIKDVLHNPDIQFTSIEDFGSIAFPAVTWQKIRVTNEGPYDIPAAFTFCHLADSIALYVTGNNELKHFSETGAALKPVEKQIPSVNNSLHIHLPAQSSQTFYVRQVHVKEVTNSHLAELYVKDTPMMIAELMFKYTGQAFYAGLMLMFALLSFFGWLLIRDRSFVYFSLVHLAFTFYFLAVKNVFGVLVFNVPADSVFSMQSVSISLLITSLFVFISHYMKLRQHMPRFYHLLLIVTIFTVTNRYFHHFFTQEELLSVRIHNGLIMLWLVIIITAIALLARRRIPTAVNLLVSLSILVLTAVVYLLALSQVIPQNFITMHSIQIGSVLFSLLVFYRLFEAVRTLENEKQRAETINDVKTKFFTNLSHEFRTPLTLILSPLEQLNESADNDDQKNLIQLAKRNANRLLNMINQLLDIARIEGDEVKLSVQEINVTPYLKGVLMSFESLAELKEIELRFSSDNEHIPLWFDTEKMEVILYNLLSNGLKFTSAGGTVSVEVVEQKESVQIHVKDTGEGIPADRLPFVFDRFFRIENTGADGSGIGLCLAKELTELHQGKLTVESALGKGSIFTLEFKKGSAHLQTTDLADIAPGEGKRKISTKADLSLVKDDVAEMESDTAVYEANAPGTRPAILLVEDNMDVRAFIRSQLIDRFQVLEAVNGQAGFEMAVEHVPELIISDVMMPGMNGIELCKLLKQDVRTSHIPVILLTAKAEQEHRMEGLEAGADEYLHKPFRAKELNLRIHKLIELRIELRNRLMESPTLSFKSLNGNPVENEFIEQISTCINDHLADPQFGVSVLANSVKLSVPQLNRKLKSITGLTANKYVQHVRLKKALVMLENEDFNVSEVAHQCGFSSTAYFVKSFREHYGKTPGSMLRQE